MTYMPKKPRERLSQQRLIYELRLAIDHARNAQTDTAHRKALEEVDDLIRDHPLSIASAFVQYNIGTKRREWLSARMRAHATPLSA